MLRRYTCRHVRNLLPLHVGGDLPARQAAPVEEHLHTCLPCFREYRELTTMRERIGVLTEQPLPEGVLDGFADEIMARIAVGEPGPRAELPLAMERARTWPRYAAAAALLISIGLAVQTYGAWGTGAMSGSVTVPSAGSEPVVASAPPADDLGIFAPPTDDTQRPLARPPVFDAFDRTEIAGDETQRLMPLRRGGNAGAVPSFSEGARVLVDAAGRQVVRLIPQDGGLQQEFGRELRPRKP
jgi:Putative zinc-finger